MEYSVKLNIVVTNPPWEQTFVDFLRKYVVPLVPLFILLRGWYRSVHRIVEQITDDLKNALLFLVALPLGLFVLAVIFGIPVIFIGVLMGWIQ